MLLVFIGNVCVCRDTQDPVFKQAVVLDMYEKIDEKVKFDVYDIDDETKVSVPPFSPYLYGWFIHVIRCS